MAFKNRFDFTCKNSILRTTSYILHQIMPVDMEEWPCHGISKSRITGSNLNRDLETLLDDFHILRIYRIVFWIRLKTEWGPVSHYTLKTPQRVGRYRERLQLEAIEIDDRLGKIRLKEFNMTFNVAITVLHITGGLTTHMSLHFVVLSVLSCHVSSADHCCQFHMFVSLTVM